MDRKEFERQLRLLTVDITDRINSGLEAQRSAHGSSLVMPAGAAAISEDVSGEHCLEPIKSVIDYP